MKIWKLKDVLRLVNEDPDRPLICGGRTPVQGGGLTNVDTADIEDDAVTTPKINDLAVTLAKIANTSITNAKIAVAAAIAKSKISSSGTWDASEIPSLAASIITSGQLALARGGTGVDNSGKTVAVLEDAQTFTADQNFDSMGLLIYKQRTELTISAGEVTITQNTHIVDTEGDAATDDLDTINGGSENIILYILGQPNATKDTTFKDGTGNLLMAGDFTLTAVGDVIEFGFIATNWKELSRSDNA